MGVRGAWRSAGRTMGVAIAITSTLPAPCWGAPNAVTVVPSASSVKIDLMELVVTGNTVLDAKTIEGVVEPFMGPGRTMDDVDLAREALQNAYLDRGYKTVSVRIPKQVARDGVVQIEVVENRVGRVDVIGSRYHSLERIKALAPSVADGSVTNFDRLQTELVALNSVPDMRVTPALKE